MTDSNHKLIPLFTIHDVKSNIFAVPWGEFSIDTDIDASRYFISVLRDYYSLLSWFNPADCRLFRVGYFDIDTGYITGDQPELILDGASLDISDWTRARSGGDSE